MASLKEVLEKYNAGEFFREIPIRQPIKVSAHDVGAGLGYKPECGIYRQNQGMRCSVNTVSNHRALLLYREGKERDGGRCYFCLQDFTGPYMGLPKRYEMEFIENGDDVEVVHVVWDDGVFCCDECKYGYIQAFRGSQALPEEQAAMSLRILLFVHKLQNPGSTLECFSHRELLKPNGGAVSVEKWKTHKYTPGGEVFLVPSMRDYQITLRKQEPPADHGL